MSKAYFEHADAASLQAFLSETVPAVNALGLKVSAYDGRSITVSAPLDMNINDKGTAFGGSLYNVCVMASWGMTALLSLEEKMQGDIVVAKGEIEYFLPLQADLKAVVERPSDQAVEHFVEAFQRKGKAVIKQKARVMNDDGETCVVFEGKFALLAK